MKLALESAVVLLSLAFVYLWTHMGLKDATPPVIGFFVVVYLILSYFRSRARRQMAKKAGTPDAVTIVKDETFATSLLIVIVLLLMYVTGGFNSLLFFLLYFVSFSIAFTLEPEVVFVYLVGVLLLFFPEILTGSTMGNLVKIGSLFLLSPLAYFFGKEFREHTRERRMVEELTEETENAAEKIDEDVSEIIAHDGGNLDDEEVARLKDIVDQTKKLEGKE